MDGPEKMDDGFESRTIVRGLAAYLQIHPLACDTAEGIARWWFGVEEEVTMQGLTKALQWMAQRGYIEEIVAADGRRRYRCQASQAQLAALQASMARNEP